MARVVSFCVHRPLFGTDGGEAFPFSGVTCRCPDVSCCIHPEFHRKSDFQMTVLRPRSRSISVRLSEEEFAALQAVCIATGARSISDLARKAMQEVLERVDAENTSNLNENGRSVKIKTLERKVEELAAELATFKVRQTVRRSGA